MNNDLAVRYLAFGDLLDEQVRQDQLTSTEAKARLAVELQTANTEYERPQGSFDAHNNELYAYGSWGHLHDVLMKGQFPNNTKPIYSTQDIGRCIRMKRDIFSSLVIAPTVFAIAICLPVAHAQAAAGTGVFVSEDGFIVTNNHVVEGCASAEVRSDAGHRTIGEITARDAKNDLALIRSSARPQNVPRIRTTSTRMGEAIAAFFRYLG